MSDALGHLRVALFWYLEITIKSPIYKPHVNCKCCRALKVFSTKYLDPGYAPSEKPIELTVSETAVGTKHKIRFTDSIWDTEDLEQDNVFYLNFDK